jgi:AraC-like DNA-binding protein
MRDMSEDTPARYLVYGAYGPYILHGEQNRRHKLQMTRRPKPTGAYCAVMVDSGAARLRSPSGEQRLALPAGILLWPGDGLDLSVPAGSSYRRISFDAVYQLRRRGGGQAQSHATNEHQPSPQEIWGIQPGPLVPDDLLPRFRSMMYFCAAHWWRGSLSYARSNARLGAWLLDWAASFAPEEDLVPDDTLADVERQAIDSLESGVTVADMAGMAGLSRRHFNDYYFRRREETPGEFLRRQRIQRAERLLQTTAMPVKAVAALCGFSAVASFSRAFSASVGRTPTAYRRECGS